MRKLKESGLLVAGSLKLPKMCEGVELDRSEESMSYCAGLQIPSPLCTARDKKLDREGVVVHPSRP